MSFDLDVTTVWQKNWNAMNDPRRNEDGSRLIKYIINRGTSRSSKTFSIIDCYDMYARSNRNMRMTAWRDTKVDAKDTILNDMERRLRGTKRWEVGFRFNKTDSHLHYNSGSKIEICGADDDVRVHGKTQNIAWLNEPYKIGKYVFNQIDQRCDLMFIDWNPKEKHWVEDVAKLPNAIEIFSTFQDNPFCPPDQKKKILAYQPVKRYSLVDAGKMTEKEAREYNTDSNLLLLTDSQINELIRCRENELMNTADEYSWSVYGLGERAERPNRIYRWKKCTLAEYLAIDATEYFYSDWGTSDPWAVGGCKYHDGRLFVREINYMSENEIRSRMSSTEAMQVAGDPESGLATWKFKQFGITTRATIVCDNNRPLKILALRKVGYDYSVAAPKKPGSKLDGISLLSSMEVFYTAESVNIESEQENYSRKTDRYGVVLEEPEDGGDHHCDGIAYVSLWLQKEGIIRKV